ncbi:unnamed protein product [Adineta ricciae]|uniref:Transmembrane protein n=1 Tax=Adineta ricciae TaxID=249248 RepID=A0A814JBT6_ADIRI|nr:unnamed protein product [Adineta ricciae]
MFYPILVYIICLAYPIQADNNDDDPPYNVQFAINDHFAILAQNEFQQFIFMKSPYNGLSTMCKLTYFSISDSRIASSDSDILATVYSVTIGCHQNTSSLIFAAYGKTLVREHRYLVTVVMEMTDTSDCPDVVRSIQFVPTIGIDVFLQGSNRDSSSGMIMNWPLMDIDSFGSHVYAFSSGCILKLNIFDSLAIGERIVEEYMFEWGFFVKASQVLTVERLFVAVYEHHFGHARNFCGQSVVWIDEDKYAILCLSLSTLPWSSSQVQIYSYQDLHQPKKLLYTFPNNQQAIDPLVMSHLPPYEFHSISSWTSGLVVALDVEIGLIIPMSSPGFCSRRMIGNYSMVIYGSDSCIIGTSQNTSSSGPCLLCPPGTMDNGSFDTECQKCSTSDYCLRGALTELTAAHTLSYAQTTPYPESATSTEFDDVLLQNIFRFSDCLFQSPLLWISIVVLVSCLCCLFIGFLIYKSKCLRCNILTRKLCVRFDLIGEGKYWMGGFLSLPILVLIIFAIRFDRLFANLYPIESISNDNACDPSLLNAKFTSTLQLLSIHRHPDEQILFDMLDDEQTITLILHFLATGFTCSHLTVQYNTNENENVFSNDYICSYNRTNGIITVSLHVLPSLLTLQFHLQGPYFIGGLRICFSGSSVTKDNRKYVVENLDICQFYHTPNETLTANPTLNVEMIKTINRTEVFSNSGEIMFNGRWLPMMTMRMLSDSILYRQREEKLRYLSSQTTLTIQIMESKFYIKNTQEPIARQSEIIFKTLLFATLCLELAALAFLIVKLVIMPFVRLIQHRIENQNKKNIAIIQSP